MVAKVYSLLTVYRTAIKTYLLWRHFQTGDYFVAPTLLLLLPFADEQHFS